MKSVLARSQAVFATILKLAAPGVRRAMAVAFGAFLTFAGGAMLSAPAYAITIDFSTASVAGFTFDGLNTTNGNCPSAPPCDHVNNAGATLTITALSGTFDFASFLYKFQGSDGTLTVTSDKTTATDFIALVFPDTAIHTYNLAANLVSYFTGVTWIKFTSDNQANVRIDDITLNVAAVPVPAGIALGASALGLLGVMGWRRKKAAAA